MKRLSDFKNWLTENANSGEPIRRRESEAFKDIFRDI
jgi:hypothetical protein